jgi:hypothetical protein
MGGKESDGKRGRERLTDTEQFNNNEMTLKQFRSIKYTYSSLVIHN